MKKRTEIFTSNNVEHLLALLKCNVIGDEGHLILHLDAGVPGTFQYNPALSLLQNDGPDVGHRGSVRHVGKADNGVQLSYHIIHRLHGLCIAWFAWRRYKFNAISYSSAPAEELP